VNQRALILLKEESGVPPILLRCACMMAPPWEQIADVTGVQFGSHDRVATVPCVFRVTFVACPRCSLGGIKKGSALLVRSLTPLWADSGIGD
jgi:hypothetical protein